MFQPVEAKPDLIAQEHDVLRMWAERRTFARLRAQNAEGERWSFLDGPITANSPMGVHHAWGRTYKDVFQRFRAMLGHAQRWQNGFDWSTSSVTWASPTSTTSRNSASPSS